MRLLAVLFGATALAATGALAADDCKFCANEIVVSSSQLACLKERVDQASRDIGDKNTALIDLLSCGQPGAGTPQSGVTPQAPPPVRGAPPSNVPAQIYRLTRSGLACVQRRLANPPTGQDPIHLSALCT